MWISPKLEKLTETNKFESRLSCKLCIISSFQNQSHPSVFTTTWKRFYSVRIMLCSRINVTIMVTVQPRKPSVFPLIELPFAFSKNRSLGEGHWFTNIHEMCGVTTMRE